LYSIVLLFILSDSLFSDEKTMKRHGSKL